MDARAYTGRARAYMPLDPTGRGAVAGRMHFGVVMFPTDYAMRVDDLARAVEARGFESLWFPEHTHIPVSRRSPWPGGPTLPKEYWHTHDLFVALATAAAVTTTLKVGSGICLLVVDYCDGWLPISVRAGDLEAGMAELSWLAREKGRDPRSISVSVYGVPMDAAGLARLRDLGVERAIFALPSAEADTLLPLLDRADGLARQLA